ncbi:efflux RND transporter permease subunit [Lusitaniella coriacea LEGE 07157]|uniref:Efflux RND transporter permease subunit n=1 Tax=Lusitaniella coriacea LEGE 07157 TaxID=945747 RepID=A0A8J7DT14_9CYAN|nr:efflux RND transporter permease subunit [Lusitaniella coriacea]MBE9115132.1 efflux RND transporter permease subunit [Lusitaniella coriacea LEGE 07157]
MLLFVNAFIKRPVLTTVCSLVIVLVGAIAGTQLPIAQLPEIAPTQVQVTSTYIGADAQTVENSVTGILEREINGVEGMKYIESNSSDTGTSQITVTFDGSVDKDLAQVNVQNRVAIAEPQLPEAVIQTGIITEKASSSLLLVFGFFAEDDAYDDVFISNYVDLFLLDPLKRVEGVGRAVIFGERKYAMRLWLNPNALASRSLTSQDVANALREQSIQVGVGAIGQQPAPPDQEIQMSLRAQSRFTSAAEFENLVIATGEAGNLIKLKDIGRAELGAQNYDSSVQIRSNPGVGIGIYQLPGSNALEVARKVKATIAELEQEFPPGLTASVAFDTTEFVESSLKEVLFTLLQAISLVILIIFVFLQDWRTTVIPAVTIPVSLIGTLAFLKIFGFEINTLTLFGLVLATGLVVDDAIVVVEAISSKISQGMTPRKAAIEAMGELTGAVIATSIVLMAVFIPIAFFPGTTGKIYQQFALTIAFTVGLSTFNALTFSPTISALLLRRKTSDRSSPLGWFFRKFNAVFSWITQRYRQLLAFFSRAKILVMGLFLAALGLTFWLYQIVPSAFIPAEDQGYFLGILQAPEGVSLNYTQSLMEQVDLEMQKIPEVKTTFMISGFGFDGSGSNKGVFFGTLTPWDKRTDPSQSVEGILGRLNGELQKIPGAFVLALNAPPVQGLSNFGGFEFQLQDRSGGRFEMEDLVGSAYGLIEQGNQQPAIAGSVFTQFSANAPQLEIEIDRDRVKALNIDLNDALTTLGAYLGSQYINDFTYGQRSYRVYIQADPAFRSKTDDINNIYVRSQDGRMISLGNLITTTPITGAQTITHFNLFRAIKLQGQAAPGYSSGQALQAMIQAYQAAAQPGVGYEWMGTALEEISSGGQAPIIFGLGLVMVFLVLAAQYESYIDPIIILLTVPLAILGALSFLALRGLNLDVYAQVGLVMLIGLASKNAILIVEFANQRRAEGANIAKAALEAGEARFRPILMTAISSLVGFFPLVIARGAGSASRWSLGTAVFGGLFIATILSLFLVPILYMVIKNLERRFLQPNQGKQKRQTKIKATPKANLSGSKKARQSSQTLLAGLPPVGRSQRKTKPSTTQVQYKDELPEKVPPSNTQIQRENEGSEISSSNTHIQHESEGSETSSSNTHIQHEGEGSETFSSNTHIQHESEGSEISSSNTHIQHESEGAETSSSNTHIQNKTSSDSTQLQNDNHSNLEDSQ